MKDFLARSKIPRKSSNFVPWKLLATRDEGTAREISVVELRSVKRVVSVEDSRNCGISRWYNLARSAALSTSSKIDSILLLMIAQHFNFTDHLRQKNNYLPAMRCELVADSQ